jgi:hypothetical protein
MACWPARCSVRSVLPSSSFAHHRPPSSVDPHRPATLALASAPCLRPCPWSSPEQAHSHSHSPLPSPIPTAPSFAPRQIVVPPLNRSDRHTMRTQSQSRSRLTKRAQRSVLLLLESCLSRSRMNQGETGRSKCGQSTGLNGESLWVGVENGCRAGRQRCGQGRSKGEEGDRRRSVRGVGCAPGAKMWDSRRARMRGRGKERTALGPGLSKE